ncbi:hypothetical protein SO802_023140 [Lithocarpus litseifolius]|uniref:GAT domain-containing protein n=1 Tax=Lithocarpus litseifolius TaxID=425828 RepID=A0AAW2C7Y1_9ROSI
MEDKWELIEVLVLMQEDLTLSMLKNCKQSQPVIKAIIESTANDEGMLFEALYFHDELEQVIFKYEQLEAAQKAGEQQPENSDPVNYEDLEAAQEPGGKLPGNSDASKRHLLRQTLEALNSLLNAIISLFKVLPVLLDFYPLIRHFLIFYPIEMGDREIKARVGESESSSSSSSDSVFEITPTNPSSSLKPSISSKLLKFLTPSSCTHSSLRASSSFSVTPFHALSKEYFLDDKDLESIRGRFQIPEEAVFRLPHTSEKACSFAHGEVSFYEAAFSCGLRFPIHPFIHHFLSKLNIAPGQLVPNAWRTVVSCMAIWFIVYDGEMITLNEFPFLYKLKPSTHYEYFELSPWDKQTKIVHEFPTSFRDWKSSYFFVFGEFEMLSNDLWGEVPRLLRRWEIPILVALFFSSRLCFLFILLISDSLTFFLICFVAVEQPKLEEQYQGCVEAALEFAFTLLS